MAGRGNIFGQGINFNDLPAWQRRGVGLYWESYGKEGFDPVLGRKVTSERRRIKFDEHLPAKDAYGEFIQGVLLNPRAFRLRKTQ